MKSIMKQIQDLMREIKNNNQKRQQLTNYMRLDQEANHLLQVREYDGKLFICYNNIPVIEQSQLDMPIEQAVKNAREVYHKYFNSLKRP